MLATLPDPARRAHSGGRAVMFAHRAIHSSAHIERPEK
ncbi:hypothetical protein APY04_3138 [Hyphomicrobium sulfonivorans]|uniref:Uncharacterized protein n=1 Tax=Hyphomicrobium sulfonivorans TaxID=121290 RepID=A0A109B9U0_HYPSL|nr:hypothetical protein APY04_3138 [Hyphomicrobium sulfonivorans]